ncbi:hypothetical protein C8R43DRAFT_1133710 [Mycena crocata]|nr:hypothetical protein C8R43DRAFT_1133710 [Mycena crocata]
MWDDVGDDFAPVTLPDAEPSDDLLDEDTLDLLGLPDTYSPAKRAHKRKLTRPDTKRLRKANKTTPHASTQESSAEVSTSPNFDPFLASSDGDLTTDDDFPRDANLTDDDFTTDIDLPTRPLHFDAPPTAGQAYDDFAEGVTMGTVGFYQISESFFVCEGWNGSDSTGHWYHLQVVDAHSNYFACTCERADYCVHRRYMKEEGLAAFSSSDRVFPRDADCKLTLFSRELTPGHETISLFTVASANKPTQLKYRAIVTHTGASPDAGTWSCSKDSGKVACPHAAVAKDYLTKLVGDSEGVTAIDQLNVQAAADTPVGSTRSPTAVSHLPIMPPVWAFLDTDTVLYPRTSADLPPPLIPLGDNARCRCGATVNPARPTTQFECTVYTLTRAVAATIEVQICHECSKGRRNYVGPDCRDIGIFNYNNRTLFSHALFDDYNAQYTASETPFASYTLSMSRRYQTMASIPFVSGNVLRAAWFLFADLQVLGNDMTCPQCGDHPNETIWDGVTLAFGRTKLSGSLCPPTALLANHPVHSEVAPVKSLTMLADADLRKSVRKIVTTPAKAAKTRAAVEGIDEAADQEELKDAELKLVNQAVERVRITPDVCTRLKSLNSGLGELFETYFGLGAVNVGISPPNVYLQLFKQIAAEESALQMITLPVLASLNQYRADPTPANLRHLLHLPAIYELIQHHRGDPRAPTNHILSLLDFLAARTLDVATRLTAGRLAMEVPDPDLDMDPWNESGCYYSMPAVRLRPAYPNLRHDQGAEGGRRGATYNKFYNQYGKQRLTGGIMCVWCTHSICYGFHCIPQAEGRNDVFSAIITRWVKAPGLVIYDFSCALAAYCMSREPLFFANTHFLIDDFHAFGHTKCSHAAFLKTYAVLDPPLAQINTSAAECGNGGLSRIRKGVSYMGQTRAIVYTRTFLALWNRAIIKKFPKPKTAST